MADEDTASAGAGEPRRRRVPPPTIDLEATDVSPPTAPDSAPPPETAAPSGADPTAGDAQTMSAPADDRPDKPPHADEAPAAAAGPTPRATPIWPMAAAGALGAVLALIVVAGLWVWFAPANDQQADLNARLSRIETQLGSLSRVAPATADAKMPDDLAQRLGRIEATLGERLAAVDREIKPLSDRLADLGRRDDETVATAQAARERADAAAKSLADVAQQLAALNAARAKTPAVERSDLDALATRLTSLEASTKQIGDQLSRIANASSAANIRRTVVALALNAAVERGVPYRRELAAIDPAAAGAGTLDALKPFADAGVPSVETLARELAAVMPDALRAVDVPAASGSGFFGRLQSNAERLVRIRPIAQQAQAGEEPAAVLSRVEAKTRNGDITGALAEAAKLPATARAPLDPWIKRAQAREAALAAAATLATQSLEVKGATDK